jgi:hypothetical protein
LLDWAPPPRPCRASSAGPRGLRITAGPRERFHSRFILLRASIRLQSLTKQCPPPVVSDKADPFHEVSCLIAPSAVQVRRRDGFHTIAAVRPQVFATSRRFAPRSALRACFIPLARPGFPLQGFSLAGSRHGSSPRSCPLSVTASGAPLRATFSLLGFKALLSRRVRCVRSAVKRAERPIPSWASILSRASFTSAVDRVPALLPSRASLASVRDGCSGAPQGLVDRRMGRVSRHLQPS